MAQPPKELIVMRTHLPSYSNLHLRIAALLTVFAVLFVGMPSAVAATTTTPELLVSKSKDRSNAVDLNGAAVAGDIYVTASRTSDLELVRFFVDDPTRAKAAYFVDKASRFDLAGGNAFNTRSLADGQHVVTAVMKRNNGQWLVHNSTFQVKNTVTATAPATTAELLVSKSKDRSNAVDLNGAAVAGDLYVTASRTSDLELVRFFVDDPTRAKAAYFVDKASRFDLAGGNAFNTRSLADGQHVVTAVMKRNNGQWLVHNSTFQVKNTV